MLSEVVLFYMLSSCSGFERPRVHTQYGDVFGTEWYSFKGRKFNVFMSIPFAEKPLGNLRFEDPKEPKKWYEPIDGGIPSPECIQSIEPHTSKGEEDCLYINVFTPTTNLQNITTLLPVIIHIHGGAFYFFSGLTFGPRYLLDKDIVLVTFNYRLGIFGFLSTEDEVVPGNAGMKDQVMALGWVQRNIGHFGGDPASVTLMGMSAGAASVHYHYFSILSRGLFQRGFLIGGNAFNVWAVEKQARVKSERVAHVLGCPSDSSLGMVSCLKARPAQLLARTVHLFKNEYGPLAPWAPVVDRWSRNPFLTELPIQSLLRRRHYDVPLLVSDATSAGLFPAVIFENDKMLADLDLSWNELGAFLLDIEYTVNKTVKGRVMEMIKKHYFGGKKSIYQNLTSFEKMVTDRLFLADAIKGISFHAACNHRIYFYLFNFKGLKSTTDSFIGPGNKKGVAHIDDLYYMMNKTYPELIEARPVDVKMIERLTEMVYNFAKTGKAVFLPEVYWPPVRGPSSRITYLRIDSPDSAVVTSSQDLGDGSFWDSLPLDEPWAGRNLNP